MNVNASHKAPYQSHQVLFRAKIISTSPEGDGFKQDVIDINGNRKADVMDFKSAGCARREVLEPTIHAGTDAGGRPVGMRHLREEAATTGQRYFGPEQLSNWSVYKETISFGDDGGSGSSMHDWQNLKELGVSLCPEYRYRDLGYAIDVKRNEFVVYDPAREKS